MKCRVRRNNAATWIDAVLLEFSTTPAESTAIVSLLEFDRGAVWRVAVEDIRILHEHDCSPLIQLTDYKNREPLFIRETQISSISRLEETMVADQVCPARTLVTSLHGDVFLVSETPTQVTAMMSVRSGNATVSE